MFDIELTPPERDTCRCCGAEQIIVTRFVARDGAPFAIYKAVLTRGDHEARADMVIGIGDWTEQANSKTRAAFFCQIWAEDSRYNVSLVDANQSAWGSSNFFGDRLDRVQALQHRARPTLFELTDYMVQADAVLANYLDGKS